MPGRWLASARPAIADGRAGEPLDNIALTAKVREDLLLGEAEWVAWRQWRGFPPVRSSSSSSGKRRTRKRKKKKCPRSRLPRARHVRCDPGRLPFCPTCAIVTFLVCRTQLRITVVFLRCIWRLHRVSLRNSSHSVGAFPPPPLKCATVHVGVEKSCGVALDCAELLTVESSGK